jgi:uncharacterized protein (TIGR00730 family)
MNSIKISMRRICVNCGSNPGLRPEYQEAAERLGKTLAEHDIELVYGGAAIGLMGRVADAVLDHGGRVTGVVPVFFAGELAHRSLTRLHIVDTMHQRKQMMFDLSDAFIALPGGMGTLEEVFEIVTWAQIGHHEKPFGFLNVCGYYDKLIEFIDHTVAERFVRAEHRQMILVDHSPAAMIRQFSAYKAPRVKKWLDR